jgi:hypothetical protein
VYYLLNLAVRLFCAIIGAFPEHIYLFCQNYLYFWSIFSVLITIRYTKVSGLKTGNIWQLTNRSVVTKNFYYTSIQTCMTQILRTSVIGEKKNA